jgi:hypothetical protein
MPLAPNSTLVLNGRFELWDTERANAFVAENYPDLLETYLGYGQGTFAFPTVPPGLLIRFVSCRDPAL